MALNRSKNYGTRWETSSEESPQGKFKDKSSETAVDGSYLQKSWINDISDGWNGAILKGYTPTQEQLDAVNPLGFNNNAGVIGTPVNEIIDKANDSQVYNAWYKHTQEISNTVAQDVVDTTISNKQIEEKIAELQTIADGCYFNWYAGDNAYPANTNAWINFENTATSPIIVKNNFTLDSSNPQRLIFNQSGNYAIKIAVFSTSHDATATTMSGTLKFFKNYTGSDPSTSNSFQIGNTYGVLNHSQNSTVGRLTTLYGSDNEMSISPICFVPAQHLNVDKDDFLTIHMDYNLLNTVEITITRVGKKFT